MISWSCCEYLRGKIESKDENESTLCQAVGSVEDELGPAARTVKPVRAVMVWLFLMNLDVSDKFSHLVPDRMQKLVDLDGLSLSDQLDAAVGEVGTNPRPRIPVPAIGMSPNATP